MTARRSHTPGPVHAMSVACAALNGNFLGDPSQRRVEVWTPPGHDGAGTAPAGLWPATRVGPVPHQLEEFRREPPERLDRLGFGEGTLHRRAWWPFPTASPDLAETSMSNSSHVMGQNVGGRRLLGDIVPAVEDAFSCGGDGRRGVFGKSSGGYGAIYHALRHSDFWSGAACHSGDMGFELCYARDFPAALRALAKHGGVQAFMDRLESNPKPAGSDIHVLMTLAMAATYDPDPSQPFGVRLPVDLETCERIEGAVGELAALRPAGDRPNRGDQTQCAKGPVHRLRRGRPVRPGLRRAPPAPACWRRKASTTAMRNSPTTIPASITAWTYPCPSWRSGSAPEPLYSGMSMGVRSRAASSSVCPACIAQRDQAARSEIAVRAGRFLAGQLLHKGTQARHHAVMLVFT